MKLTRAIYSSTTGREWSVKCVRVSELEIEEICMNVRILCKIFRDESIYGRCGLLNNNTAALLLLLPKLILSFQTKILCLGLDLR